MGADYVGEHSPTTHYIDPSRQPLPLCGAQSRGAFVALYPENTRCPDCRAHPDFPHDD